MSSSAGPDLPQERIGRHTAYWYERHLFAYRLASARFQQPDGLAVDLGCGKGYGLSEIGAETRLVVGIDRHIPTLQSLKIGTADRVGLVGGDVTRIPLQDDTVDVLVTFQVIEHLTETDSFLLEITRVLKPGGTFFLTTPNAHRSDRGIEFRSPWHVHEYVWDELDALLNRYFAHVYIRGIDLRPASTIARSDRVVSLGEKLDPLRLRRLMPRRLRAGVLRLMGYVPPAYAGVTLDDFVLNDGETSRTVDLWAECRCAP